MAYEFTEHPGYVQARLRGQVTMADLAAITGLLDKAEAAPGASPHRVFDITEAEDITVNFVAVHDFSARRRMVTLKNQVKTAIVAKTPVQFGCARMFQMVSQQPQTEVAVFSDAPSALAWVWK